MWRRTSNLDHAPAALTPLMRWRCRWSRLLAGYRRAPQRARRRRLARTASAIDLDELGDSHDSRKASIWSSCLLSPGVEVGSGAPGDNPINQHSALF